MYIPSKPLGFGIDSQPAPPYTVVAADLNSSASNFNVPVSASTDFSDFIPVGVQPPHAGVPDPFQRQPNRRRKKMNSFVREASERVGPSVVRLDMEGGVSKVSRRRCRSNTSARPRVEIVLCFKVVQVEHISSTPC